MLSIKVRGLRLTFGCLVTGNSILLSWIRKILEPARTKSVIVVGLSLRQKLNPLLP